MTNLQAKMEENSLHAKEVKEKSRENTEKERSNRAKEGLEKRGQNINLGLGIAKTANDFISGIRNAKSNLAKGVLGVLTKNDPAWYAKFQELVAQAGKLPLGYPAGVPLDLNYLPDVMENGEVFTYPNQTVAPTAVLVNRYIPSYGGETGESIIQDIAQRIYTYVRHANSGHSNYDPTELMFYLLGVSALYEFYAWMCRIYGIMNTYSVENRNYPRALMEALGLNFEDFLSNLSDFKMYIEKFRNRIEVFSVPKDLSVAARRMFLNINVFKDRASGKAQTLMFNPEFFYTYGITGSDPIRSQLTTVAVTQITTFAKLCEIGNRLINNLYYNEDIGIMSGDILKAYGSGMLWTLPSIDVNYSLNVIYDEVLLRQWHNTVNLELYNDGHGYTIDQDATTGKIKLPIIKAYADGFFNVDTDEECQFTNPRGICVDFDKAELNPLEVMEYTRNICVLDVQLPHGTAEVVEDSYYVSKVVYSGSEIFTGIWITYASKSINGLAYNTTPDAVYSSKYFLAEESTSLEDFLRGLGDECALTYDLYSKCDWLPRSLLRLVFRSDRTGNSILTTFDFWETDNVNYITVDMLSNLHYAALYSQLVPSVNVRM